MRSTCGHKSVDEDIEREVEQRINGDVDGEEWTELIGCGVLVLFGLIVVAGIIALRMLLHGN